MLKLGLRVRNLALKRFIKGHSWGSFEGRTRCSLVLGMEAKRPLGVSGARALALRLCPASSTVCSGVLIGFLGSVPRPRHDPRPQSVLCSPVREQLESKDSMSVIRWAFSSLLLEKCASLRDGCWAECEDPVSVESEGDEAFALSHAGLSDTVAVCLCFESLITLNTIPFPSFSLSSYF